MAKYVVVMVDHVTGDRQIQDDEYDSFDSYEAAQDYANECAGWETGMMTTSLIQMMWTLLSKKSEKQGGRSR